MPDVSATATAFIRDICAEPDDDGFRLIFADYLEENGQKVRAEFIRVQCQLTRMGIAPYGFGPATDAFKGKRDDLRQRERRLLLDHWQAWVPWLSTHTTYEVILSSRWKFSGHPACLFRRGFISEVTLPCADFLHHAEALFRAAPIARVTLSDKEPAEALSDEMGRYRWWRFLPQFSLHEEPNDLPFCLFKLMRSTKKLDDYVLYFDTREAALIELSTACVRLGRQRAGLPELTA